MVTEKKKNSPEFGDNNISQITVWGKKKLGGGQRKGQPCPTNWKKKKKTPRDMQSVGQKNKNLP